MISAPQSVTRLIHHRAFGTMAEGNELHDQWIGLGARGLIVGLPITDLCPGERAVRAPRKQLQVLICGHSGDLNVALEVGGEALDRGMRGKLDRVDLGLRYWSALDIDDGYVGRSGLEFGFRTCVSRSRLGTAVSLPDH